MGLHVHTVEVVTVTVVAQDPEYQGRTRDARLLATTFVSLSGSQTRSVTEMTVLTNLLR